MKKSIRFIFIFFYLLSLYACGSKPYPKALLVADSLANTQPDSAVVLLKNMEDCMRTAPDDVRMYYRLLCVKANDKAYIPHTSDSLILSVLSYFTDKKDKYLLPEVYYYAGRVYRDLGDAPQALEYFEEAMETAEERKDFILKSKIYSQMGTLFTYQDMYAEAADNFRRAYQNDVSMKDSVGMVFDLRDIASTCRYMNEADSALHYYRQAYDLAAILQHRRLMNMVENQMASLYIELKQYDLAKRLLQPSLNNLHRPSKSAVYSIASKLYHRTGDMDSARYYYNELLEYGTIYAKRAAHRGLAEIALLQSNPEEALSHLRQYTYCADSIRKITDAETIRKMCSLYNYHLREKENVLLKAINTRRGIAIACILAIGFILAALAFAYLQYSRRKRLLLSMQLDNLRRLKEEQCRKSLQFIEEDRKFVEELENRLQNADQINNSLRIQLHKQKEMILYANKQVEIELSEREMAQTTLLNSDIYNLFSGQIQTGICRITEEDWTALEDAVNDAYSGFSGSLRKLYPFSSYELHICLLIKINIQPVDMAKLTNHTKEAISATRRRLYEKVFLEKGSPKQWDEFILSL